MMEQKENTKQKSHKDASKWQAAHKTTSLTCINTTKLNAFSVLLPPQDQQEEIVDACSSLDAKIRPAQNKKTQLQDLFRTLLHELMTARTRVHGIDLSTKTTNTRNAL